MKGTDIKEYRHTKNNPCHISAGGVIFKKVDSGITVVVLGRELPDGAHYHLPKGTVRHNETLENCAKREVLEESGYETEILDLIGSRTDSYTKDGIQVEKTTIYFAMQTIKNTCRHDAEHDFVTKMDIDEAIAKMRETEPDKEEYLILEKLKKYITSPEA